MARRSSLDGIRLHPVIRALAVADTLPRFIEQQVGKAMDDLAARHPGRLGDVLFRADQKHLVDAIAADLVEVIPLVKVIPKAFRIRDAAKQGDANKVTTNLVDMLLPIPLPDNLLRYVRRATRLSGRI